MQAAPSPLYRRLARALIVAAPAVLLALLLAVLTAPPARAQDGDDGDPLAEPPLLQPAQAEDGSLLPPIVINEIFSKPELDTERLEFVELYNGSAQPVALGFWTLAGGIDFTFPADATIPARGYLVLAENPAALRTRFGAQALGPLASKLAVEGEAVELRSAGGELVDEVHYANGFPWPTVGQTPATSIQLVNPAFDNAHPGSWRSGAPTPGTRNSPLYSNAPPAVASVSHSPAQPQPGQAVTILAAAQDPDGILSMKVAYQVVRPGAYIRLTDPAYAEGWAITDMAATGQQDEEGNAIYSVQIPAAFQQHRTLIRYRIYATDSTWKRAILPYADDPQPNFAYFVYGGVPAWTATLPVASPSPQSFEFDAMRSLPVMQFIARHEDVADALFLPDTPRASGYMGNDYNWYGTFVYNDVVYDHVTFRPRGGEWRFATGKTNWKINFNPGHRLQMVDNYGRPYGLERDKLNLGSVLQQVHRKRRGEQGMFESMTYRLFEKAGVAAPTTDFIHWRVITDEQEYTNQYRGDFWGLYLAIEQPSESFLEERDLPDGNLYKMEAFQGTLDNLGRDGPTDGSDLAHFMYAYSAGGVGSDWWRANVDLEGYYSFRSILEFTHNYDVDQGKNYYYYHNPDTGKWSILPWDVDLTWEEEMPGTGVEPFVGPVFRHGEFYLEYQNRLRELRDLLLNEEQINLMLAEQAAWIDTPQGGLSMVDADRYLWDDNPIYQTRYVVERRSRPLYFYVTTPERTFRAMVDQMREWTRLRLGWIDGWLLTDRGSTPFTPGLSYAGGESYAVDTLRFVAGEFGDPQGASTFAALEWRIAEVTDPAAPVYSPDAPILYEIDAVWQSDVIESFEPVIVPPSGVVQPGHSYRVRVRMRDTSGRWSHWSQPVSFVARAPALAVDGALAISEIMYHPAPWGNLPDEELEFIELKNLSAQPMQLYGLRITGGIDYEFDFNFTLEPFKFVVLVKNRAAFQQRYPYVPFGEYRRNLSNSSDTVTLQDGWGRTLAEVTYSDAAPWPTQADGEGYSLSYNSLAGAQGDPAAWSRSRAVGGSPGYLDPNDVWINEVLLFPEGSRAVELYNPGAQPVDVSYWYLSDNEYDPRKVRLPAGARIPARGFLVLDAAQLATPSYDGPLRIDPAARTGLVLTAGRADGWTGDYQTHALIPYAETGVSYGRVVDGLGQAHMVAQTQPSFGGGNSGARTGPVVISAIHYFPSAGGNAPVEYIELTNSSSESVKLYAPDNPALTWQVQGVGFSIPAGTELAPGARLLVTSIEAADACAFYGGRGLAAILGPTAQPLSNDGQEIALVRPVKTARGVSWVVVDSVAYTAETPWPAQAAGQGAALRRADLQAWGGDATNWQITAELPGPGGAAPRPVPLCSFAARAQADGVAVTWALDGALAADVTGFTLWRNSEPNRMGAVQIAEQAAGQIVGQASSQSAGQTAAPNLATLVYTVTDTTPLATAPVYYWLEAVRSASDPLPVGFTALAQPWQQVYLPVVRH